MPKLTERILKAVDTETTGLDLRHGADCFFVTICDSRRPDTPDYWEWEVDYLTRMPIVPLEDLMEIQAAILEADELILQNAKFDVTALDRTFRRAGLHLHWDWSITHDTLYSSHLLASNQPKDLTTTALVYLGVNIKHLEDDLKKACEEARRIARAKYPEWLIAKDGLVGHPSAGGSVTLFDMALPRAIAKAEGYAEDHPWWTVLAEYSNADSVVTLPIHLEHRRRLTERGLWDIYQERRKLLPVVQGMEDRGVTVSRTRLAELRDEYRLESARAERVCVEIAASRGYELTLPKSGNNKSLTEFVFSGLSLPALKRSSKTGEPSLDKTVLEAYEATLPERSKALTFIKTLKGKRSRDTALSYMEGYERYWQAMKHPDWFRLFPSLNVTGTDTLRWSSSNPNEQNISKKEGFNLRYCFGPSPGREWWSLDAKNIELRIPAYGSGETAMIDLFEKPDEPPYFGSNHLLFFDILHPDKWDRDDPEGLLKAKKKYASTWYQWTKNGDFAVQYGAVAESGTADRAYHVPGAQARIESHLKNIKGLSERMIETANRMGYVETMPDRTVDSERGYPLLCARSKWGRVLPTVPLSYHVQGTAMWVMGRMMLLCDAYLKELSQRKRQDYFIVMQIHDELVFDFPFAKDKGNLPIVRECKRLMDSVGFDLVPSVPLPVGIEYHPNTWAEGESCE